MAVGFTGYPSTLDTISELLGPSAWPIAVPLLRSISDDAAILPVETTKGYADPPNMVVIDGERIVYQGKTERELTGCLRGQFVADGGLTPRAHTSGAFVRQWHTSTHHRVLADAIMAVQALLSSIIQPGFIMGYGGNTDPAGWLICEGRALNRLTYAALFGRIGTAYGAGDGVNTFNIPNLQGRVLVGLNTADVLLDTMGETGGEAKVTLTSGQSGITPHNHSIGGGQGVVGRSSGTPNTASVGGGTTGNASAAGASQPHENMPPFVVGTYIIKT